MQPKVFSRAPSQPHSYDATAAATGSATPRGHANFSPLNSDSTVSTLKTLQTAAREARKLPPKQLSKKFLESMVLLSALANADKDGLFPSRESQSSFIKTLSELPIFNSIPDYIKEAPVARNAAAAKAERDAEAKREAAADAAAAAAAAKEAEAAAKASTTSTAAQFNSEIAANNTAAPPVKSKSVFKSLFRIKNNDAAAAAASPTSTLPVENWRPFPPAAADDAAPDAIDRAAGVGSVNYRDELTNRAAARAAAGSVRGPITTTNVYEASDDLYKNEDDD